MQMLISMCDKTEIEKIRNEHIYRVFGVALIKDIMRR